MSELLLILVYAGPLLVARHLASMVVGMVLDRLGVVL